MPAPANQLCINTHTERLNPSIQAVLLATDFLQSSRLALDYAAAFARRFHSKLVVLNAFEFGRHGMTVEQVDHVPCRRRREAEARLHAFTAGLDDLAASAKWAVVEGPVQSAILNGVLAHKADLLVLGTQGVHRGISHLLIGSNTEGLMLTSPCPTLTIGPHVHGGVDPQLGFSRILYLSDFTVASAKAVAFAYGLAHRLGTAVEIYQVQPDYVLKDKKQVQNLAEEYCAALTLLLPNVEQRWCAPDFQISRIVSADEMLGRAMDTSALMVLGVQPASYLRRHVHTSLPYCLLAEAACPILTVTCNR